VIHADRHGAVVVPSEAVTKLPAAIALIERRERVILDACRAPNFSAKDLREIMKRSREIH
jgi:regulator of RNase E activity RraA